MNNDNKVSTANEELRNIYKKITNISSKPYNYLEAAALLESQGYTDRQIKSSFGYSDVFKFSEQIFDLIEDTEEDKQSPKVETYKASYTISGMIFDIYRGILSVCPLLISMVSVFAINFSLWSFMDKTRTGIEQATAIAFATILSMIISGGFSQPFLREGHSLLGQNNYKLIWKLYVRYLQAGVITALILGFLISVLGIFTRIYKIESIMTFALYFISLTAIWMCIPVVNLIKAEGIFAVNMVTAILLVYALKVSLKVDIVQAQILGMISLILINLIWLKILFAISVKAKKKENPEGKYKTRWLINMYLLFPFFLYGLMYYVLIFMDRLIAWSANSSILLDPVLRMKGEYELGMNWAILAIVIPTLLIEVYVKIVINNTLKSKKKFTIAKQKKFATNNIVNFAGYTIIFFCVNLLGAAAAVKIISKVIHAYNIELGPYFSDVSKMVFMTAVIGYTFIIGGLLNNIYLLYFLQGKMLLKVLSISIGLNFIVGFTLSRNFDYYFAVFGFLAGAAAFFLISLYYAINVIADIDYYFYKNK